MSRFRKLSQSECVHLFTSQQKSEEIELNVQIDHVHLLVLIPLKISVSNYVGLVKGRTAIRVLNKFRKLRQQPYWGNRFCARGYCADTVGLDADMIQKYVRYCEGEVKKSERTRD